MVVELVVVFVVVVAAGVGVGVEVSEVVGVGVGVDVVLLPVVVDVVPLEDGVVPAAAATAVAVALTPLVRDSGIEMEQPWSMTMKDMKNMLRQINGIRLRSRWVCRVVRVFIAVRLQSLYGYP